MASYGMSIREGPGLPSIHKPYHERNGVLDYGRGYSNPRSRYERSLSPSNDVEHVRVRRRSLSPAGRNVTITTLENGGSRSRYERSLSPSGDVEHIRVRRSDSPGDVHVRRRSISPPPRMRHVRGMSPPPPPSQVRPSALYQRPVSASYAVDHNARQMADLQEQLRTYREELSKKDCLISQLTKVDTPRLPRPDAFTSHIDEVYSQERLAASAAAKSEIAGLTVRVEGLQSQNRELQAQVDIREEKIRELKMAIESARENEAKQMALSQTMRTKLAEFETQAGSFEGAATRSEVAIQTLQRQIREQQQQILELESKFRAKSEEVERIHQHSHLNDRKYTDLVTSLTSILSIDNTFTVSHEGLVGRVTDMAQEIAMLRGKMDAMKEYMNNAELETKASRETITRLVSEAEREQRNVSKFTMEMDSLRQTRETAVAKQREMEREIDLLKERLDASQRAWNATRAELEERETRFSRNEGQVREFEMQSRTTEQSFRSFKEQMAGLLSDSYVTVEPYEEDLRERLSALVRSSSDRKAHIEMLEGKVHALTEQLNTQLDLQRGAERRAQKIEGDAIALEDKLRRAEGELAAGDMLRDGMRFDKERYLKFLEEICHALRMDAMAADMGMEHAATAILARIQQVVGKEGDLLVDRKTHIYNLQRKIKALKEQMDSKELHMELLRKKCASLEERACNRTEVEREKDEEFVKNRKLLKLVDKYKRELNECRLEIRDLKARLLESADIRSRTLEQEKELENLEVKVGQLEHVRQKQAHKINGLRSELDDTVNRFGEKKDIAHNTVVTLTNELKSVKLALQEITNRERQLLDLRQVIARMLGLDVTSLAVPDYEIISRLEKLILANQSNVATVVALDTAMRDVSDGFRIGYENASKSFATRSRSPVKVNRSMGSSMTRSSMARSRARSMSPAKKRDPRQY